MSTAKKTTVIKRYQNRKLYDTRNSTYVTLEDIRNMIKRGDDIRVIDNKSKEDLTSITLTQIIFEEQKKNNSILPLFALKNIIRDGGGTIRELLSKTGQSIHHAKEGAENIYGKIAEADENILKDVIVKTQSLSKNIEGKIKATVDSISHVNQLQSEVKKLRPRILYLEKKLRSYEKR